MDLGIQGKHAVVTGGASGIGEAVVRAFLAEGARVSFLDKDVKRGEALAGTLPDASCHFIPVDLVDADACARAVQDAQDRFGPIGILVNNAGVNDGAGIRGSVQQFRDSLEKNLVHTFSMMNLCADSLVKQQGAVVNVSSKVSLSGQGGTSGYAASKGGINSLTREWALEFAPDGVRVNAVLPAEVWTPQYAAWIEGLEDPEQALKRIEMLIPLGQRMTKAEEIADAIVFLASSRASHITGQLIQVDGGYITLDNARITRGE